MKLHDGKWSFSPTDLANFLRCEHRVTLDRMRQLRQIEPPKVRGSAHVDLLSEHGKEHERDYVQTLKDDGKQVVVIPDRGEITFDEARQQTLDAMQSGDEVIVQALLTVEPWLGYADFLFRRPTPSNLGDWSYEVGDTKLARNVHPEVVLQLGVYCDLLESIQGIAPKDMWVILGDGNEYKLERSELDAYIRRVQQRFKGEFADPETKNGEPETEPYPVTFCQLCKWNLTCYYHWRDTDHLSLVAEIRRDQIKRLAPVGITTLTALGEADPQQHVPEIAAPTFEKIANQARLQLHHKRTGKHKVEFLEPENRRGFQRLPKPSPGDLFFDVEADPFEELVYLFGLELKPEHRYLTDDPEGFPQPKTRYTAHRTYLPFWGHSEAEERRAFESTIDFIIETLKHHPDAHVYHYGPADVIALKKLMGKYGSREEQLDDLLRRETFVDLLGVVRQSIRISHPSYSLKKVETFYMERENEGVIDAGGAIVAYQNWLAQGGDDLLEEIEEYNREDCDSTLHLQAWLLDLRQQFENERGIALSWPEPREPEKTPEEEEAEKLAADDLSSVLHQGLPEDREPWTDDERAQWILGHLLHYHRRDAKPAWWEYFERLKLTAEELVEDKESIGHLEPTGRTRKIKSSTGVEYRFPPQQYKLKPGDSVFDPARRNDKDNPLSAGEVAELGEDGETIWLKRGPSLKSAPPPEAIIPGGSYNDTAIREALRKFARSVIDLGFDSTPYEAAIDVLLRRHPRLTGSERGQRIQDGDLTVDQIIGIARRLDRSALFIQGPPGSGKTYRGARIVGELIRNGLRVGVSATSHKAIHNLLHEIEKQAFAAGLHFRGLKRSSEADQYRSKLNSPLIRDTSQKAKEFPGKDKWDENDPAVQLVAGTPWCFSSPDHDQQFDVLIIDEAGQMALATALAVSTAARSVILLGDPLQLAQVSQGTHPDGCGASVLEHLLGDFDTIPEDRGIFLQHTRRMHPDVCKFISSVVYNNRLESAPECSANVLTLKRAAEAARNNLAQGASPGTPESQINPSPRRRATEARAATVEIPPSGLLYLPIPHTNNSQDSPEEAEAITTLASRLLTDTNVTTHNWSKNKPITRPLTQNHILVVTPYNAQVRQLKRTLAAAGLDTIRVGTVDKFQGQEAPIVFFSMATSSGEEVPRTLDFLFSRNRLNVAISRAQCLAILVASPKLLDVHCKTIEQMKLVNSLCRFVEMADPTSPQAGIPHAGAVADISRW